MLNDLGSVLYLDSEIITQEFCILYKIVQPRNELNKYIYRNSFNRRKILLFTYNK